MKPIIAWHFWRIMNRIVPLDWMYSKPGSRRRFARWVNVKVVKAYLRSHAGKWKYKTR